MLSSNVQSIDLPMDCMAWRFWTMRQVNGCSTPAPRSSAAKQWFEQLAQKTKKKFIWQQHTCGAVGGSPVECGVVGQPHKTPHFHPRHPPAWNDPSKKSLGLAWPPPHRCLAFPLLLAQMRCGFLCSLWVWRRTNRRPCCPPMSYTSTSPWTAWPDGSGGRDNRMAAQHLPRDLV